MENLVRAYRKYILKVVGFSIVPLILLSVMGGLLARAEIRQQALNGLASLASSQEARVEQVIQYYDTVHNGIASRTQFRVSLDVFNSSGSAEAVASINRILVDARAPFQDIKGLLVLGPTSQVVTNLGAEAVPTNRYEELRELGSKASTLLPVGGRQNQVIVHAGPIRQNDKVLGVLVIVFTSDSLRSITAETAELGQTGETVLGYRDGEEVVLFPTRFQTTDEPIKLSKDSGLPMIPALNKQEQTFTNALDYRGHKILAATQHIEATGWGVVTKKDQGEVFASLTNFSIVYTFISVVIISCTTLALLLAPSFIDFDKKSETKKL